MPGIHGVTCPVKSTGQLCCSWTWAYDDVAERMSNAEEMTERGQRTTWPKSRNLPLRVADCELRPWKPSDLLRCSTGASPQVDGHACRCGKVLKG